MRVLLKRNCIFIFVVTGNYLFLSCSEKEKSSSSIFILEVALYQVGDNCVELEKVLSRYKMFPKDSLKYKTACFLIENMPYYTYL